MKILYFEDNGSAMQKIINLRDYGHDVWCTESFSDAMSWILKESKNQFDALIFDLIATDETLPQKFLDARYDETEHVFPSLYFIRHFILKEFPALRDRIILCTAASVVDLDKNPSEIWLDIGQCHRVSKNSERIVDELPALLNKMEAQNGKQ